MVFSSASFLFYFFPCFLFLYYFLPWKNATLLAGSLVFYAWGEPRFVPLLVFSALLNYTFGRMISRADGKRKFLLWIGVVCDLALLVYYKYAGFLADGLNSLLFPFHASVTVPEIVLPLGISFFTFQGISYLIDVYRGDIAVQKSFLSFAMYKAMFPQLIAGPIVRYSQIADEVDHRVINNARIWRGFQQFVLGLAQKVLIANTVALTADRIFAIDPSELSTVSAWIGIASYSVQILFDFAGYSNMAIGIGHMLGFTYPPNFQSPYSAQSITDFWRRWHISLSSWFRDYVYIPLGGNRLSNARTYVNLAIVFFLCGLWHGAAWTFVIWGLWHGALLIIERLGLSILLRRLPRPIAQVYVLVLVMTGWVFFRAANLSYAIDYLHVMYRMGDFTAGIPWQMHVSTLSIATLFAGLAIGMTRFEVLDIARRKVVFNTPEILKTCFTFFAMCVCVGSLAAGTYNPFIYFHF